MRNDKEPYIILLASGESIIESNLEICIAKAQARASKPIAAGWLCVWGCGNIHAMTPDENKLVMDAFPNRFHNEPQDD